jgi:hypothetical protein
MMRSADPTDIDHPQLCEFALQAERVAKLEDAVGVLEGLVIDLVHEELPPDAEPEEDHPLEVALALVEAEFEEADRELEARVTEWLAEDPEHWPIFRLIVLDPWQERPGRWREDVPGWVRTLGTNTALAHFQQDPLGRQRMID